VTTAGIAASPRAAWLLLRVGQHPETSRRDLAGLLCLTDAELERRLTELVAIGYVRALRADLDQPVPLTEAGQHAFGALFRARQESVARLAGDWDPDKHPGLMSLLDRLTHQLATSGETPGPDLDHAGAVPVSGGLGPVTEERGRRPAGGSGGSPPG
jgi:DNA-binding MarR family transcriptional regulator